MRTLWCRTTVHQLLFGMGAVATLAWVVAAPAHGAAAPEALQALAPASADQQETGMQEGVTALTRGPLHEAFAEVVNYNPEPGVTVPKQPPGLIEELPPDQKPEGEGYVWIPGYWAWSDDHDDYIWTSGVWRTPPPNTAWVPGYWAQVQAGWRWVSGYWKLIEQAAETQIPIETESEVTYLPEPPQNLEQGPSSPQSSDDHFWVPGCWRWYEARYVWRPGYWAQIQPGWIWIPARYLWTPSGCVFVPGHWDYTFLRRGLCFTPVYFDPVVIARPRFVYVPTIVVNVDLVFSHLFCRPRYGHYYFGDYYDPIYRDRYHIYPWFTCHERRFGYDPLFVYNRWYFSRRDPDWERGCRRWFEHRVEHADSRPPHTFADQVRIAERHRDRHDETTRSMLVATTLKNASHSEEFPVRLARIDEPGRRQMTELSSRLHQFTKQREEVELKHARQMRDPDHANPLTVQLSTEGIRTALRDASAREGVGARTSVVQRARRDATPEISASAGPQGMERRGETHQRRDAARAGLPDIVPRAEASTAPGGLPEPRRMFESGRFDAPGQTPLPDSRVRTSESFRSDRGRLSAWLPSVRPQGAEGSRGQAAGTAPESRRRSEFAPRPEIFQRSETTPRSDASSRSQRFSLPSGSEGFRPSSEARSFRSESSSPRSESSSSRSERSFSRSDSGGSQRRGSEGRGDGGGGRGRD